MSGTGSPSGFVSEWGTDMVKIFVGQERKEYIIHKDLICKRSPFFDRTFNGSFGEATTHECHLAEDTVDVFEVFRYWLYSDVIPADCTEVATTGRHLEGNMKFYVIADKFLLPDEVKTGIMDAVLKEMRTWRGVVASAAGINAVLRSSTEDSPMLLLAIDIACNDYKDKSGDATQEWLAECLVGVPLQHVTKMFQVISSGSAGAAISAAAKRGIEKMPRYQVGHLKRLQDQGEG